MTNYTIASVFSLNRKFDANAAQKELRALGHFGPDDVVQAARNPKSAMHACFEWDDAKCGHAWRHHQARNLILSIQISDSGIRAFESVVIDNCRVYVPNEEVAGSDELTDQVLEFALKELLYWKAKNQRYSSFFGKIFGEIDVAEQAIRRKNGKNKKGGKRERNKNKTRNSANKKVTSNRDNHRR